MPFYFMIRWFQLVSKIANLSRGGCYLSIRWFLRLPISVMEGLLSQSYQDMFPEISNQGLVDLVEVMKKPMRDLNDFEHYEGTVLGSAKMNVRFPFRLPSQITCAGSLAHWGGQFNTGNKGVTGTGELARE